MRDKRFDRRWFLKTASLPILGCWVLRDARSARAYAANEKLGIAVIGVGRRGGYHVHAVPRIGENLVAICDADRKQMERVKAVPPKARFQDFRKMLDSLGGRIDAAVIATPDHTHAPIAAELMRRGKHVFVEKPCAHDVAEARALRRIAREKHVATQQGNQGMATDSFRRTLELVQEGAIGEVREAHVWFVMGGSGPRKRPSGSAPVPDGLDWDLWLGPAARRPYHPDYHRSWWAWREFSTGILGGGGSHSINMAFMALDLGSLWGEKNPAGEPIRVEVEIPEPCPENLPRWQISRFHIPARSRRPPAVIHWYNAPEAELRRQGVWKKLEEIAGRPLEWKQSWTPRSGSLVVGSQGAVHTNAHNSMCALLPEDDFPDSAGPPRRLPRAGSHEREWTAACRGGARPFSSFEHSGPSMELLLLGNVASQVNRTIRFDPSAFRILEDDQADRALRPEHREGWCM